MKKIVNSLAFFFKVFVLVLLLVFGWVFVNVTNLIKGKKSTDGNSGDKNILGPNWADADVGGSPGDPTTPFIAYHDGSGYKLENDILFGRPKSNFSSFELGKQMYEEGMITPDLYKITAPLNATDGKLLFQIQEIEPEESFFKWLELRRILHPARTEVMVDSEFKKFYIFDKKEFEQAVVLPASIVSRAGEDFTKRISSPKLMWDYSRKDTPNIFFEKDFSMGILFKDVRYGEIPYLIVKSWYRDWVMGDARDSTEKPAYAFDFGMPLRNLIQNTASVSLAALASWAFYRKGVDVSAFSLPFFAGFISCCFTYEYMDWEGNYQRTGTLEPRSYPRSWKPNTEIIELPREAVRKDNTVKMRISATKRHAFGFIGLVQNIENFHKGQFEEEKLGLSRARHNRSQTDVKASLINRSGGNYVHTIPGDTVDIEFAASERKLKEGERETYLIKSSGFYTALRPEYKRLAGNWQERISEEAKSRLATLVPINEYQ